MEGTHGQLRSGFADRLRRQDADGHSLFHSDARGHVQPVAPCADAQDALAGQRAANANGIQAQFFDFGGDLLRDDLVFCDDEFVGDRVSDGIARGSADDVVTKRNLDFLTSVNGAFGDALDGPALDLVDDDVLGDVGELSS